VMTETFKKLLYGFAIVVGSVCFAIGIYVAILFYYGFLSL